MIDFKILKHRRETFARVTGVKLEDFDKIGNSKKKTYPKARNDNFTKRENHKYIKSISWARARL